MDVLRADAEMDRLRNLIFLRHIENPENLQRQASLQVIFMTQSLERAGDHAKNLAEEVCHFVSGHTVRHVLMTYDKPIEQMFSIGCAPAKTTRFPSPTGLLVCEALRGRFVLKASKKLPPCLVTLLSRK